MGHIHPVKSHPVIPSKDDRLLLHGEATDDYLSPLGSCCVPHHGEMGLRFCYLVALSCVQSGGWSLSVVLESAKVTSSGGFPKTQYFSPKKQRLKPRNCLFIWANWLDMKAKSIDTNMGGPGRPGGRFLQIRDSQILELGYKIVSKRLEKTCLQIFENHVYTVTAYFGNWTKISFGKS